MIDFEWINRAALLEYSAWLFEVSPGGKIQGDEYIASEITGGPGGSFSFNLGTGKWADFAKEDKGGDAISLVAAVNGIPQGEAALWLCEKLGINAGNATSLPTKREKQVGTWTTCPAEYVPRTIRHPDRGMPSKMWNYLNKDSALLGNICRFDNPDGSKDVLPFTYGEDKAGKTGWRWKAFSEPRPLYGLDRLATRPDAPVVIVEGEKCADAARRLIPSCVSTTWPGGCKAVSKANWRMMKSKRVGIWPDNDEPGRQAAKDVAQRCLQAGAAEVFIIDIPSDKPDGWDISDAEVEGWTTEQTTDWIKNHRQKINPKATTIPDPGQLPVNRQKKGKNEWPEIQPLITHEESTPYPVDSFPDIIGAAVREVVDFVQCPTSLAACSALAAASTVVQGLVDVRRANGLEGPISLFFLGIAYSGERKSSVDGHFTDPIREWVRLKELELAQDLGKFSAEEAVWKAKESGLLASIQSAAKSIQPTSKLEEQLLKLGEQKPECPVIPHILYNDATPEALAYSLAHRYPIGAVMSNEGGTVLGAHGMGKDSIMRNLAMLNVLWDGQPLQIDRRSVPSYTVDGVRLSMCIATQPDTILSAMEAAKGLLRGIGFFARFLIAWPESTQGTRMFKDPPATWPNKKKFHERLYALLNRSLNFDETGRLNPDMLELSTEAKQIWVSFHDDVESELRAGGDMSEARDVASKAADNVARLAALFHVFENRPSASIGQDHIRAAASIVSWHLYEAKRFLGEIGLPAELQYAVKLDAWLIERCKRGHVAEIKRRDIQQLGPYATRRKANLDGALDELIEAGRVKKSSSKAGKLLVQVNPKLLEG